MTWVNAYGHQFVAHTDSQGRKGYALFDNNPHSHPYTRWQEIAVIYPKDPRRSVQAENNASLSLRDYGTTTWQSRGTHSLNESLRRAAQHADRYYEKYGPADARFDEWVAEQTLADRVKARTAEVKEQRDAKQDNQTDHPQSNESDRRAWNKNRDAKRRRGRGF